MINESQPCEDARQQDHSDDDDEDPHDSYWEKLSILDRLGLKSTLEMNEEEVESEFIRLSVGFHCDQYTLKQRLQTEEHERLVAEENVQRELLHTRDVLQVLCDRLTDVGSREIVLQMKNRMKMMEENMENVLRAAESLGAVHQEARVSHAAAVMSAHVEHLNRRHMTDGEELLEARKLLHRRRGRLHSDSTDDRDALFRQSQQNIRRRVSVTLLPSPAEMMDLETVFLQSSKSPQESDRRSHLREQRRQVVIRSDSSESHLTFDPSAQHSTLKQDDDDDDNSVMFSCLTQGSSGPVEGEESELSLISSIELCVRPLLIWTIRILIFCLILLTAVCFRAPV